MCGFLAYIGDNLNSKRLESGLSSISHRGPDSSEILKKNQFTFGFNRLAIQDLSSKSMQPMVDLYGNIIIYNGEIYNFKEIKKELESNGYEFKTNGDVEVIMKSILHWGFEKSLKNFEGMFAIVYYSKKENKIYACRDFFGIKPIFYSFLSKKEVLFSSEIKAIAKYKGNVELDFYNSINPIFFTGMPPKGKTMFKDIFSLNEGHIFTIDLNNFNHKTNAFFKIDSLIDSDLYKEISRMNKSSITNIYKKDLSRNINQHLVSDAKCGVLFSAGLDSSIIAGEISNSGIEVDLFKYENDDFSDKKFTKSFLDFSKQTLHEVSGNDDNLIYELPKLIYHYETINKSEGVALSKACELSRNKGYKALLTGDCADELFAGYITAQEYFTKSFITNLKSFDKLSSFSNKIIPGFKELFSSDLSHFISPYSSSYFETFFDMTLFGGEKKNQINKYRNAYNFLDSKKEINSNAFMLDEIANRLERFLIRADRFGMMESIELRVPYLTKSMVKLALNTPYSKKTSFRPSLINRTMFSNKVILKRVAKSMGIPKSIVKRAKVGTAISEINFKNELKVFKNISLKNASDFLKINQKSLKKSILLSKSKWELRRQIWNFLALDFLIDQFVVGNPNDIQKQKIQSALGK